MRIKARIPKIKLKINFSESMLADLYVYNGAEKKKIGTLYPDKPFEEEMKAGKYSLELYCSRKNNYVDYTLEISTDGLVDGLTLPIYTSIETPASIPVSINKIALVRIFSEGPHDTAASLFDSNNNLIFSSDDSFNDWNFSLPS